VGLSIVGILVYFHFYVSFPLLAFDIRVEGQSHWPFWAIVTPLTPNTFGPVLSEVEGLLPIMRPATVTGCPYPGIFAHPCEGRE
jgi:hypothetical protein